LIIAAAVLALAASQAVTIHKTFAATTSTPSSPTTPIIVNPPTTISQCPLGAIPESTTTGTVCLVIPTSGYGFSHGFSHGFHHHY
jgi:hypothetical protein